MNGSRWSAPLVVVLLAMVPYLNGLRNGFTFDDVTIAAQNPRIRSMSGIGRAFTTDWWDGKHPQSLLYRPLTMATFAIDCAVATRGVAGPIPVRLPPDAARAFHVQNLLWHGAASVALFLLVLELSASPVLAFAAAALFAVHPVHTEAVDGIVGRAELMSACFSFLSLLFAWRAVRDDSQGAPRSMLAGAFLLLALLSKEQAIVIPAVPLLWILALERDERRELIRRPSFRWMVGALGAATLLYLCARAAVLGSPVAIRASDRVPILVDNPVSNAEGIARVLTPVRVFGEALRVLVFPRTLSADYSYDQIPLVTSVDAATIGCAFVLLASVAGVLLLRRRVPVASFGLGFFLLSWALTSNLFVVIGTIFGERLLYLPSAGFCLAAACGLMAAGRWLGGPRLAALVIAVLVVLCGVRTWSRNSDWKDDGSLFAAAAEASPRSCKALNGHASQLLAAKRPEAAVPLARRALAVFPSYPSAHYTLARGLREIAKQEKDPARKSELRGEASERARWLIDFYAQSPGGGRDLADAWNMLGCLALDEKRADEALRTFRKGIETSPDYEPAITGYGAALAMQADDASDPESKEALRRAALAQFERALVLDPTSAAAREDAMLMRTALASAAPMETRGPGALADRHATNGDRLLAEKRLDESLAEFREAARLQPRAGRGFLGIGTVLVAQSDREIDTRRQAALIDEAIESFEHALALEPGNPSAHMDLGIIYLSRRRDPAKVVQHFRAYLALVPDTPRRAQMEETIRKMDTAPIQASR
jgi:cytochrome c-type biogenesis protein CcmH/NrfG